MQKGGILLLWEITQKWLINILNRKSKQKTFVIKLIRKGEIMSKNKRQKGELIAKVKFWFGQNEPIFNKNYIIEKMIIMPIFTKNQNV